MKLLVLGGTRFVGRAIVAEAIGRGADVTVLSRGESGEPPPGVTWVRADRTDPAALAPLAATEWDAVLDTWDGAPDVVATSASLLAPSARWYGYVSSRSVYRWPPAAGSDESAPVVDPTRRRLSGREARRRARRPGPLRGPGAAGARRAHPRTVRGRGRLTWWLQRAAAGGSMVAPEPADLVWQLIDARDLARFLLDAAAGGPGARSMSCALAARQSPRSGWSRRASTSRVGALARYGSPRTCSRGPVSPSGTTCRGGSPPAVMRPGCTTATCPRRSRPA